jgi:hypothetical protein
LQRRRGVVLGQDRARAQLGQARVDVDQPAGEGLGASSLGRQAEGLERARAEDRGDGAAPGGVLQRHLGAQLVAPEPAFQVVQARRFAVHPYRLLPLSGGQAHEELVQELALGRQQGGPERALGRKLVHVVGDHALKEWAHVGARGLEQAARFQDHVVAFAHSKRSPRAGCIQACKPTRWRRPLALARARGGGAAEWPQGQPEPDDRDL